MIEKLSDILLYENTKSIEFILCKSHVLLMEDKEYIPLPENPGIPRFTIKGLDGIENIPINKPLKPTEDLFKKAIKYGMIFVVSYKGKKDTHNKGHERVIYPMVLGRSSPGSGGNLILRGYHLDGWSVSNNDNISKMWRLFRFDKFISVTFTGSFYRLPPEGYNQHDKGMRGGILASADFNVIRKNQQELLKTKEIQNREDIEIGGKEGQVEFNTVRVKTSGTQLDLDNPYDNPYIKDQENADNLRLTFLKTIYGEKYICVMDALGKPGNHVKVLDGKNKSLGVYKVLDCIDGKTLKMIKKVKGNTIFDLHFFDKKI
jgi:hypothetical protein